MRLTLLSTAQPEFCRKISGKIDAQNNRRALETDSHLRVAGAPLGEVYAIGDCATVQNNVADHLVTFLRTIAWEKRKDPERVHLTFAEWRDVAQRVKKRFPQAANHLRRLDRLFEQYDTDRSGTLDFEELRELLLQIDSKLTSLPATAQRANQQGEYLGRKFNKIADALPGMKANEIAYDGLDETIYKAFEYKHLGSLAYIGNAAIFDINGTSFSGGLLAVYLWRSIYFAQSVSLRTRVMLAMDWAKRAMFGRGESVLFGLPIREKARKFGIGLTISSASSRYDEFLVCFRFRLFHPSNFCLVPRSATISTRYIDVKDMIPDSNRCLPCLLCRTTPSSLASELYT